jgi:DNA-binding NarL/FixJ family response regulator
MQQATKVGSAVIFHRYPLVLRAVAALLRSAGLTIAGSATRPEEALALLDEREPSLFVAGVSTPPGSLDGIELLRRARVGHPGLKTVGLADRADADRVDEAFAAGASAFLGPSARQSDLALAVRQTYDPALHLAPIRSNGSQPAVAPRLTDREAEILELVAEGHSNGELATKLGVALQTVKYHLSNVYRKLGVSNRAQATRQAQLLGLLREPGEQPPAAARAQLS